MAQLGLGTDAKTVFTFTLSHQPGLLSMTNHCYAFVSLLAEHASTSTARLSITLVCHFLRVFLTKYVLSSRSALSPAGRTQDEDAAGPSALAQAELKKKVSVCAVWYLVPGIL